VVPAARQGVLDHLYARLRRQPSLHSVAGSLPVLFFGDLFSARIATVGINPSHQEYLDPGGHELTEDARRFQTLGSLHGPAREALTDDQCGRAINTMCRYFQPGKPVYHWFRPLDHLTRAMGFCYAAGQAVSLDLVQEATKPTWSELQQHSPHEALALLATDLSFLRWQLATFPLAAVVCNGKTPLRHVCGLLDSPTEVDSIAQGRLGGVTWYVTYGRIAGRGVAVMGWNIPLARPCGLTTADVETLGRRLNLVMDHM
jgi:hypothetical protein